MAGPLSGIGSQTQSAAAAQAQQQSQQNNQGVRQQDERRETRSNEVQPQNAPVNEAQNANNAQTQEAQRQQEFFASNLNEEGSDPAAQRGSIIDIAV